MKWVQKYELKTKEESGFIKLLFSWDGRYLMGVEEGYSGKGVCIWDIEDDLKLRYVPLSLGNVMAAIVCPHGLLTLGGLHSVWHEDALHRRLELILHSADDWEQVYRKEWLIKPEKAHYYEISLNPMNFDHAAVTVENTILIWDIPEQRVLKTFEAEAHFISVLYTHSYLIGKTPSQLRIWDSKTDEEVTTIQHPNWFGGMAATHHPNKIIISVRESGSAQLDILSGEIERKFIGGFNVVTHLGTKTLAAGSLNFLNTFDLETGELVHGNLMSGYVNNVAMRSDGQLLVGNRWDGIRIWRRALPVDKQYRLSTSDDWFAEATVMFRTQGFFRYLADLSEHELIETVRKQFVHKGKRIPKLLNSPLDLISVLVQDVETVWWWDLEADVGHYNRVYEKMLMLWSKISRGAFDISEVVETWDSDDPDDGPTLSLKFRNRHVVLHPENHGDYIDIGILRTINKLIEDSPIRFEVYECFDQTAVVLALTTEQKRFLKYDLAFGFQDYGGHVV